ncbi:6-bladed beta-propeller [Pelovirga terrestris]|nr:6-bladed beta-propeller [Pelovirga terrestris]
MSSEMMCESIKTTRTAAVLSRGIRRILSAGVVVMLCCGLLVALAGTAVAQIPLRSVAQLTVDDEGRALNYPSIVFYDSQEDEIYLVNGGTSRVVVYGADFFPAVSIGVGRGVEAPRRGAVQKNGDVYLLQVRNVRSERPRITVLSGAFFIKQEFFLDTIADEPDFSPRSIAISKDGLIYVASTTTRGALVLDAQGNYLRHLRPLDKVAGEERGGGDDEAAAAEVEAQTSAIVSVPGQPSAAADIPEQFRPRPARPGRSRPDPAADLLNPVRVNDVKIDGRGRIYLLSAETSKVYVYDAAERFLFSFGSKGGTPRNLSQPRSLVIDDQRELIYIADYMRHSILAYSLEGRYLFEFGGRGVGPGWFNFPEDMTINNQGQLVIADLFNRRVQVLEVLYEEFPPSLKALVMPDQQEITVTGTLPAVPASVTLFETDEGQPLEPTAEDIWSVIAGESLIEEDVVAGALSAEIEQEPVAIFLKRWANAWSEQEVELYLGCYAADFVPMGEVSRDEWEIQRRERLNRSAAIAVTLDQIRIVRDDGDQVRVEVVQDYRSDSYSDRTRKIFELQYEDDGWKIFRERSVEVLGD